ncbi:MAG: FKBP-type peptidyl-prolyl cis-trans isomerase [Proteiniphilum sp.]|nr:FKBP-type peptidyl-prolyl cis-trans isomerase [Proteiniphilum sp.]
MEKLSYALGMSMASSLVKSGLNKIDVESFSKAFSDIISNGAAEMSPEEANQHIQEYFSRMQEEQMKANIEEGQKFLEENSKKDGVVTLDSGLQYEILTEGDGPKPTANDRVKCHYHGTLIDGNVFDSSVERGQPAVFGVTQVIRGWVEALQLMTVGSKWRLFIPSDLAYGAQGAGDMIGPNTALIFDVELLGIE